LENHSFLACEADLRYAFGGGDGFLHDLVFAGAEMHKEEKYFDDKDPNLLKA